MKVFKPTYNTLLSFTSLTVCVLVSYSLEQEKVPYGDVKFVCTHTALSMRKGVVMMYSGKKYLPICMKNFNRGAAAAVCRQLGFIDAAPAFSKSYYGDPTTIGCQFTAHPKQKYISSAKCSNVSNYKTSGELHLGRCSIGNPTAKHCEPVAVSCMELRIIKDPSYYYNGFVYLKDVYKRYSGLAYMYIRGKKYSLCAGNISIAAAESICRQLGYTGMLEAKPEGDSQDGSVDIQKSLCTSESGSYPCFSDCFDPTKLVFTECKVAYIKCDFKTKYIKLKSGGNKQSCIIPVATDPSDTADTTDTTDTTALTIFAWLSGALNVVLLVILCCCCCYTMIRCCKGHPMGQLLVNSDDDKPNVQYLS